MPTQNSIPLTTVRFPENEAARLTLLHSVHMLHSQRAPEFDAVVELAADILDCPISLISIVDGKEQWFKAKYGLGFEGASRDVSFNAHTFLSDGILVVEDAAKDPRFQNNPLVTTEPGIRFYAGCPVSIDGVHPLGALCVIDTKPRIFSTQEQERLAQLGKMVVGLLRAFECNKRAERVAEKLTAKEIETKRQTSLLEQVSQLSGTGGWELDLVTDELSWTTQTKRIHEVADDYVPTLNDAINFFTPDARQVITAAIEKCLVTGEGWNVELQLETASGKKIWVQSAGEAKYTDTKATSLIGAFRDITERKVIEAKLSQSEREANDKTEELKVTLENMDQGVTVFDGDGRLRLWNQRYIDIYDKPDGDVKKGVKLSDLINSQHLRDKFENGIDGLYENLIRSIGKKETVNVEIRLGNGKIISSVHAPMPHGGWVATHSDVTKQVETADQIKHASLHDCLTGLANRSKFKSEFNRRVENLNVEEREIAVMLIDVDHFKQVNDSFGHNVGDKLLVEVASRLQECVREHDLVARFGGDEFAIVLNVEDTSGDKVLKQVAERIITKMSKEFYSDEKRLNISVSMGVAKAATRISKLETLLFNADRALYEVKDNGRGHYQFYDDQRNYETRSQTY